MKLFADNKIIPMIMFHSIGMENHPWVFSHLSEPLSLFAEKLAYIVLKGYRTIFWSDLYKHISGRKVLRGKYVVLTFDDGYLDNWVYVFPLLKKYGIKTTIFVNPEFVDTTGRIRPNQEAGVDISPSQAADFLSWEEMRQMEASGLVDIQSHAMTHTWYFSGEKIADFFHPGNRYLWMAWNARPERKPYYMKEDQSAFIPWGTPVYEYEKSLICRRFFPSPLVTKEVLEFAAAQDSSFWNLPNWRSRLLREFNCVRSKISDYGYTESENEYIQRVRWELAESKRIISEQLNKETDFICWPGGGYNQTVLKIAKDVGYKSWTLSSKDQSAFRNRPGASPRQVKRIGSYTRQNCRGRDLGYATHIHFFRIIRAHQGCLMSKGWLKFSKIVGLLRVWLWDQRLIGEGTKVRSNC